MDQIDFSKTESEMQEWFGVRNPTFILSTLAVYLLIIYKLGPDYVKNKEPYKLKTFIKVYNVAQVVACIYIVQETVSIISVGVFQFWTCEYFEPNTLKEYRFNRIIYFTFWLKLIELTETVVFVLRKKQNQVSYLHVFHHCTTVSLVYLQLKYYKGGAAMYPIFLNSNVHIIMYSYYFAAAVMDKEALKRLTFIKKYITTIQMIQFCLILAQVTNMFLHCEIPYVLITLYGIVVVVIFYGFYDFYKKSYTQTTKSKSG